MSKHDPKITLRQILGRARHLQELSSSHSLPEILENWMLADALERELQVLGEAVRRLPPELIARYPQVRWKEIVGTRDWLVHGYDEMNYGILWDAVKNHTPLLIATAEVMLISMSSEQDFRVEEALASFAVGPN